MKQRILYLLTVIFARPVFYGMARKLFHLSVRFMGLLNAENFAISGEGVFLWRALTNRTKPVIFDVGANEGKYAREVMKRNPQARLYCFEPHPRTFSRLTETAQKLGFQALNLGCSEAPGEMPLYDYSAGDGHGSGSTHASLSRDALAREGGQPVSETLVQLVALDDFCRQAGIDNIRLLKIDTEGFELQVLKGAQELVSRGAIDLIQFEFNEMNPYTRVFLRDFMDILPGYRLYRLLPKDLLPLSPYVPLEHELFAFQNIVAIRRDIRFPG